jgi:hypothetical protein
MKKDLNYIAALEKAVAEQYGDSATINPRSLWTEEQEKEYKTYMQQILKQEFEREQTKEKLVDGEIEISKNILKHEEQKTCPLCNKLLFNPKHSLYVKKFEACFSCYVTHIEDREERWLSGWRPNQEKK